MSIQVFSARSSPQLQSKTITPSVSTQYVIPSTGYDGLSQVTVNGSSNLVSSNIKNGVNIFGVTGNLQSIDIKYNTLPSPSFSQNYVYTSSISWDSIGYTGCSAYYMRYFCRDYDNNVSLSIISSGIKRNISESEPTLTGLGGFLSANGVFYSIYSGTGSIDCNIYLNSLDSTVVVFISYTTAFTAFSVLNNLMQSSNRQYWEEIYFYWI